MDRFAVFILAMFLVAGVSWLFANVVTGTSAGETIASQLIPIIFAVVAVGTLWRLFK